MQTVPLSAQRNGPVLINANTNAVLDSQHMVPGKTYVGILPGHTKPAFVRKRPLDAGRPSGLLTQILGSSSMFGRRHRDRYYYDRTTDTYRPLAATRCASPNYNSGIGRVAASLQQTCASCGKFRSANWQARHPLVSGVTPIPSICRRCHGKYTSSEEIHSGHRWRRHHHRYSHSPPRRFPRSHRHYTDSTKESYSSRESARPSRRYGSCSREHVRLRPRSRSRENVRVIIANQSGDRTAPRRDHTTSSSTDGVRVIRRTEIIDEPKRSRSRSRLRNSRVSYIEDGACYIDDLTRPRYYSRPRSLSRVHYLDDNFDVPRHRSSLRSSNRVTFVDDPDEPVVVSRPRGRLSRRRAMLFDGAADTGSSEQEIRGRTLTSGFHPYEEAGLGGNTKHTQETVRSSSDVSSSSTVIKASGTAQTNAEAITPASSLASEPWTAELDKTCVSRLEDSFAADSVDLSEQSHQQSFQPSVEEYESDHELTPPRSPSPIRRKFVAFDDAQILSSHQEASNDTRNIESPRRSPTPSTKFKGSSEDRDPPEPESEPEPQPEHDSGSEPRPGPETLSPGRRRRYRGSNHSSISEIAPSTLNLSPHLRKLFEMLQSMRITPPRGSSGHQHTQEHDIQGVAGSFDNKYTSRPPSFSQSPEDENSPASTPLHTPATSFSDWEHSPRGDPQGPYYNEGDAYDGSYPHSFYFNPSVRENYYPEEIYEHPDAPYKPTEEKDSYKYTPAGVNYYGPEEIYEHPDAPYKPTEEEDSYKYTPAGVNLYGPEEIYEHPHAPHVPTEQKDHAGNEPGWN